MAITPYLFAGMAGGFFTEHYHIGTQRIALSKDTPHITNRTPYNNIP